jgi:hypothetical protein
MKAKEFNDLLEKHKSNPQELIRMHCNRDIYLSGYQFDKVVSSSILRRIRNYFKWDAPANKLQKRVYIYRRKR